MTENAFKNYYIDNLEEEKSVVKDTEHETVYKDKDGHLFSWKKTEVHTYIIADAVFLSQKSDADTVTKAREEVLESICEELRRVARICPEMLFIEKDILEEEMKSVALKIEIPNPLVPKKAIEIK